MARFDQQPLEANGLVEACIDAHKVTGDGKWLERTQICFNWFLGLNDLDLPVYNMETGGCRDGLEQHGLNLNEGAESTLAWLDRKSTRLNSSHVAISYAVFCLKKKKKYT